MVLTATTVGGYLRDLPADRRVAMARVCSMIRRSARGVRESMRYGLAFYELHGPLFALESNDSLMTLFIAEPSVVEQYKDALKGVVVERSAIVFDDLNRIPLDSLEKVVRDSVAARRERLKNNSAPTQAELLQLWKITEEEAKAPPPIVRIPMKVEEEDVQPEVVAAEEPEEPVVIKRAPTFKDPAMTARSKPKTQKGIEAAAKIALEQAKKPIRRKRRTKAQIEADRLAEEKLKNETSPMNLKDVSKKVKVPKSSNASLKQSVSKAKEPSGSNSANKTKAKRVSKKA